MNVIDLPVERRVVSLCDDPVRLAPPTVYNKDLMAPDTLGMLDDIWRQRDLKPRPIEIYRLNDVYVAHEGLVFDRDLNLYRQTITQHELRAQQSALRSVQTSLEEKSLQREAGCFVLCKKRGARNYGHWLIEMMPMAKLARDFLADAGIRYIVPAEAGLLGSVISESMAMIGVAPSALYPVGLEPHWFEELVVVTGLTQHGLAMSPRVFEAIDAMRPAATPDASGRVYASRRQMKYRKFASEDEVERIMEQNGYKTYDTGAMAFKDQISLFTGAEAVSGVMGAAMTNIVFCRPGTKVLNFTPATQIGTFFWLIASQRGLDYAEVRCAQIGPRLGIAPWDTSLTFDPTLMDSILAGRPPS